MAEELKLTGKNDIKIFILFLLDGIGYPLSRDDLEEICVTDNFVSSFDFADCFAELVERDHLIQSVEGETEVFSVSPVGREVAASLQDMLVAPIRERAFRSALRILSFKKREAEMSCTVTEQDGRYLVECYVKEKKVTLMSASILVDSKERADRMKENFYERPEVIFKGLSALLACEVNYLF
ncbi:MAG: DUF4364 family protein [Ruminococcaceae bacterium]|nr:DUF4364 family protein [Oscillospiraceae bacterium]